MKSTTCIAVCLLGMLTAIWWGENWSGALAQDQGVGVGTGQFPTGQLGTGQIPVPPVSPEPLTVELGGQATEGLIALSADTAEGQQVTVIDPQSRVMSVYHVTAETGAITLKSVRSIAADLKLDEFNTASPFPREIRAMLKHR